MTRFDNIDADRARHDSHQLWLTVFLPNKDLAQLTRDLIEDDPELCARFLAATQKQFDRYVETRGQE